jgi:hypothetical protein
MTAAVQVAEARLESAALGLARFVRFVAVVTDRDVLSHLGPRGTAAITLPLIALVQTLLPRWELAGNAALPLLWCAVGYYVLRFRLAVSLEVAAGGALLAWLASRAPFWSAGMLLFVVAVGCGVLRRWLYAEFWPAHAFVGGTMAFCVPALSWLAGLPNPMHSAGEFVATLLVAPVTGAVTFLVLDGLRQRLGIRIDFPQEEEQHYDPSYVYPPFAARGSGL